MQAAAQLDAEQSEIEKQEANAQQAHNSDNNTNSEGEDETSDDDTSDDNSSDDEQENETSAQLSSMAGVSRDRREAKQSKIKPLKALIDRKENSMRSTMRNAPEELRER